MSQDWDYLDILQVQDQFKTLEGEFCWKGVFLELTRYCNFVEVFWMCCSLILRVLAKCYDPNDKGRFLFGSFYPLFVSSFFLSVLIQMETSRNAHRIFDPSPCFASISITVEHFAHAPDSNSLLSGSGRFSKSLLSHLNSKLKQSQNSEMLPKSLRALFLIWTAQEQWWSCLISGSAGLWIYLSTKNESVLISGNCTFFIKGCTVIELVQQFLGRPRF